MASVTLATPINSTKKITCSALRVQGQIPDGASLTIEVTNNAKDTEPAWENCTAETVRFGAHIFKNATAANGWAFNFRVVADRGTSAGGHIDLITGRFQ